MYDLWGLERDCVDKNSGVGHLCSMGELVKGAKTKSGQMIGLTENPARDTNYRYGMTIIEDDNLIIMALPKSPGLGAFAVVGTPDNDRSDSLGAWLPQRLLRRRHQRLPRRPTSLNWSNLEPHKMYKPQ